jgi:hypothetical protein
MNYSDSGSGSYRTAFYQVLKNGHSLFLRQDHLAERSRVWLREGLFAGQAAISLQTVSVLPKLLSWLIASWALHFATSR